MHCGVEVGFVSCSPQKRKTRVTFMCNKKENEMGNEEDKAWSKYSIHPKWLLLSFCFSYMVCALPHPSLSLSPLCGAFP
ncbi:hypothetical protein VNO78_15465 [Psophocarpus tetragonolobus]|uniref:Uncharacterized protein n=1 Tax=Psophocarpus tetragonolobus TaxID=3891 RepID=A0AAN9SG46_PSOTE